MQETLLITQKTFEEMYCSYYADVYRFIYWKLADREAAEELAQDVFIKAWKARNGFEGRSKAKTWLIAIASNHLKDYFKKNTERHMTDCSYLEIAQAADSTEDDYISKSELKRAEEAVMSLPDAYKESFVLVRFNGMSYKEAADALGISTDLLKVRVHRAHKMLLNKLSEGEV